jgi:hypothetical protein
MKQIFSQKASKGEWRMLYETCRSNANAGSFVSDDRRNILLMACKSEGDISEYVRICDIYNIDKERAEAEYNAYEQQDDGVSVRLSILYRLLMNDGVNIACMPDNKDIIDLCEYITFEDFLKSKKFDSEKDIQHFCLDFYDKITTDKNLSDKKKREAGNKRIANYWLMFMSLCRRPGKAQRWAEATAKDMWHNYYSPKLDHDNYLADLESEAFARQVHVVKEPRYTIPTLAKMCGYRANVRYNKSIFAKACMQLFGEPDDHRRYTRKQIIAVVSA